MYPFSYLTASYRFLTNIFWVWLSRVDTTTCHRIQPDGSIWNRIYYFCAYPTKVLDQLYIGNSLQAANYEVLKDCEIDSIVNVTDGINNYFPDYFDYYNINIADQDGADFGSKLEEAVDYINDQILQDKIVLVHCVEGRSRSATVLIGYLMKYHDYTFADAFTMVKEKREIVNLNCDFVYELINLSECKDCIVDISDDQQYVEVLPNDCQPVSEIDS